MSDIVERLRETQDDWPACLVLLEIEAAGEIERLREENARLREETDGGKADDCKSCGCQYESWKANYQRLTIQNDALREENARLRGALVAIAKIKNELCGPNWKEIEKARKIARAAIRKGDKNG